MRLPSKNERYIFNSSSLAKPGRKLLPVIASEKRLRLPRAPGTNKKYRLQRIVRISHYLKLEKTLAILDWDEAIFARRGGLSYMVDILEEQVKDIVVQYFTSSLASLQFYLEARSTSRGGGDDLVFKSTSLGQKWILEAKGHTSNSNDKINFKTGLGQIVQKFEPQMSGSLQVFYAMAMPKFPDFSNESLKVHLWTRSTLRLHWIWLELIGTQWQVYLDHPSNCSCGLP